jgi:hypothetical protein
METSASTKKLLQELVLGENLFDEIDRLDMETLAEINRRSRHPDMKLRDPDLHHSAKAIDILLNLFVALKQGDDAQISKILANGEVRIGAWDKDNPLLRVVKVGPLSTTFVREREKWIFAAIVK